MESSKILIEGTSIRFQDKKLNGLKQNMHVLVFACCLQSLAFYMVKAICLGGTDEDPFMNVVRHKWVALVNILKNVCH